MPMMSLPPIKETPMVKVRLPSRLYFFQETWKLWTIFRTVSFSSAVKAALVVCILGLCQYKREVGYVINTAHPERP